MTWQLHKIVLFSHDGRRHSVPENGFKSGVSIVLGDSNTGKSAILEIINYCLGASECEIADYIKRRCKWVGAQFRRGDQFALLCRQIAAKSGKSTDIYFLKVATSDTLPDGEAVHGMGTGPLDNFERMLGIGAIKLDDPSTTGGFSVSVRHCVPYSLVRDDVIINKSILISGARDEKKARHLRETLPYFLGHVTEATIRVREELRRRRAELRAREAELAHRQSLAREGSLRLQSFLDQANALGMLAATGDLGRPVEQRVALQSVARYQLAAPTTSPAHERYAIEDALAQYRRRLSQLQERRRALQRTAADAQQFWTAATGQFGRLEALDLLQEDSQHHACPICKSDLLGRAEPATALREAMNELRRDIGEVAHDRPRVDQYLLDLDAQIDGLRAEHQQAAQRLNELIKLDAKLEQERGLDEARLRLAGQVELYLASSDILDLAAEEADVRQLRDVVSRLELDAAAADVADDMSDDAVIISSEMKGIIADLPFGAEYRDAVPIFDWKHLQVHLRVDGNRKVPMPAIGSDENYLAIHLAFFLAIQKLFSMRNRPVPHFIVLDQVTRPYFPDTEFAEIVDLPSQDGLGDAPQDRRLSDEAAKVRKILTVLFKQANAPHAPQIIICEKANFRRDPDYQEAIVTFWATPRGMVPNGWPTGP